MQLQIFAWLRTNSGLSNREQKPAAALSLGHVSFLFSHGENRLSFADKIFGLKKGELSKGPSLGGIETEGSLVNS